MLTYLSLCGMQVIAFCEHYKVCGTFFSFFFSPTFPPLIGYNCRPRAYCTLQHQGEPEMSEERYQEWKGADITGWDAAFVDVELKTLFEMILVRRRVWRVVWPVD